MDCVPQELLLALAEQSPATEAKPASQYNANGQAGEGAWIDQWIAARGLVYRGPEPWSGGRRWVLSTCLWNQEHTNGSAFIIERAGGELGAGCHHNGCAGKGWHELRDAVEPGWRERRHPGTNDFGRNVVNVVAEDVLVEDPWPDPPAAEAFHGLAGEIVWTIDPASEADPVAVLVQLLVAFGNVIGRKAHFVAEADFHYSNLFATFVGRTSKGRKGSSWSQVRRFSLGVDLDWTDNRILSGLSSGEGLIWAVRDPVYKDVKDRKTKEYVEECVDEGSDDKRLLVMEAEFGSVLKVIARERNTLSAIIRLAWDSGNLQTLTKNSPAKATGAHISIIGHITRNELRLYISDTELANGLANRFLWICVKRSKVLPDGGTLDTVRIASLSSKLQDAVEFARNIDLVRRTEDAKAIWRAVYPELSEGKAGLLGAATSRAEAIVMRLALLYALLDQSSVIDAPHLTAALALWDYAENSAKHIFGSALGDPTADSLLAALRAAGPRGMTRTEMRDHFAKNKDAAEIARALGVLSEAGLARCAREPSDGQGRPVECWFSN
jgi:hypothetical protein